jgi:hypothetical protein
MRLRDDEHQPVQEIDKEKGLEIDIFDVAPNKVRAQWRCSHRLSD